MPDCCLGSLLREIFALVMKQANSKCISGKTSETTCSPAGRCELALSKLFLEDAPCELGGVGEVSKNYMEPM